MPLLGDYPDGVEQRNPGAGRGSEHLPSRRLGKIYRLSVEDIRSFAGSFADRLHRQMGLSDLESSRDGARSRIIAIGERTSVALLG